MPELTFRTHDGETVTGERLNVALNAVADDWQQLAYDIRKEDRYASHVSEEKKDALLQEALHRAQEIRKGVIGSFTIWQRVNTKLTGDCVALFNQESK